MSEFETASYQVPSQDIQINQEPSLPSRDDSDDLLGLDQQLKPAKRNKVATLNQDRVLGKTGLPYIVKNHQKVGRILKKNDKRKPRTKQEKYDHEDQNLASVLQFYQLWCHTLFPKATFKDCVSMLRGVGHRSKPVRLYRQGLLDKELYNMRVENGIIDVPDITYGIEVNEPDLSLEQRADEEDDDDDFAFMNRSNGLFVGNDEDLYTTPPEEESNVYKETNDASTGIDRENGDFNDREDTNWMSKPIEKPSLTQFSDDDFSDDDNFLQASANKETSHDNEDHGNEDHGNEDHGNEAHDNEDHDEELEIMNELGM